MKKISILILAILLVLGLAACGRDNKETTPTTQPSVTLPFMPEIDPTLDTNIPDPNINTEMPTYTDGTDPSSPSGVMGSIENSTR